MVISSQDNRLFILTHMYDWAYDYLFFVILMTGGLAKQDCLSLAKADAPVERGFVLSLVKLTRSGLVLLTSPRENPSVTTDVVSNIFRCLESGILKSPL